MKNTKKEILAGKNKINIKWLMNEIVNKKEGSLEPIVTPFVEDEGEELGIR